MTDPRAQHCVSPNARAIHVREPAQCVAANHAKRSPQQERLRTLAGLVRRVRMGSAPLPVAALCAVPIHDRRRVCARKAHVRSWCIHWRVRTFTHPKPCVGRAFQEGAPYSFGVNRLVRRIWHPTVTRRVFREPRGYDRAGRAFARARPARYLPWRGGNRGAGGLVGVGLAVYARIARGEGGRPSLLSRPWCACP